MKGRLRGAPVRVIPRHSPTVREKPWLGSNPQNIVSRHRNGVLARALNRRPEGSPGVRLQIRPDQVEGNGSVLITRA